MHDRCLEASSQLDNLVVGIGTTRAAEKSDAAALVEQRGQPMDVALGRVHYRRSR